MSVIAMNGPEELSPESLDTILHTFCDPHNNRLVSLHVVRQNIFFKYANAFTFQLAIDQHWRQQASKSEFKLDAVRKARIHYGKSADARIGVEDISEDDISAAESEGYSVSLTL